MNQKPNKYLDKDNLTKIATVANIIGQNGNVAINLQLPDYDFDNGNTGVDMQLSQGKSLME